MSRNVEASPVEQILAQRRLNRFSGAQFQQYIHIDRRMQSLTCKRRLSF